MLQNQKNASSVSQIITVKVMVHPLNVQLDIIALKEQKTLCKLQQEDQPMVNIRHKDHAVL